MFFVKNEEFKCFLVIRLLNSSLFVLHLLAVSENFCLVFLDVGNVFLANRNIVLQVEVVVNSTERQCLLFLQESQTLEELALVLILAECIKWLKECLQQ